ncbi:MAG: GreA/GreB family elongation factor [Clostridia bacterium]|nr:GreA/GreB family elongation factor [Clostridia bacterium]
MYDELTKVDIEKMKEEIRYREHELRPKLLEAVITARGFGDLSENFEYKSAKQELRKCDSRLRYLRRMIDTAKVVTVSGDSDRVELFDRVEIYIEEDDETEEIQLMTTLRQDSLSGIISKESPLGRAVMGHRVGDRVLVRVSDDYSYAVQIRSIKKGADDDSLPISSF